MNGLDNLNYNQEEIKKHKNPLPAIIIILLIIIIAALCVYIAYDKGYITFEVENKEEVEVKKEETELTDSLAKLNLEEQIDVLEKILTDDNLPLLYTKDTKLEDLTDDQKLANILYYYYIDGTSFTTLNTTYDFSSLTDKEEWQTSGRQIESSKINELYEKTYGQVLDNKSLNTTCLNYLYDGPNSKYYVKNNCLTTNTNTVINYISKFTELDDYTYVYISIGILDNLTLYKDLNKTTIYKTYTIDELNMNKTTLITKDNYQEFLNYKYTFKKNSEGNYIFQNISKLQS